MIGAWDREFDFSIAKMLGDAQDESTPHYDSDVAAGLVAISRWAVQKNGRRFKIDSGGLRKGSKDAVSRVRLAVGCWEIDKWEWSLNEAVSLALYFASLKPKEAIKKHGVASWVRQAAGPDIARVRCADEDKKVPSEWELFLRSA